MLLHMHACVHTPDPYTCAVCTGPPGPDDPAQPWPYDPAISDIMYKHVFIDPDMEAQPGFMPPAASLPEEVRTLALALPCVSACACVPLAHSGAKALSCLRQATPVLRLSMGCV